MQVFEKDFLRNVSYLLHLIPIYWYLVQVASVAWILVRKLPKMFIALNKMRGRMLFANEKKI